MDEDALRSRVEDHLREATGAPARVLELRPLLGGACQDNLALEVELEGGELAGRQRLVLRSDAPRSLPGSVDRGVEYEVIRAAVSAGVTTPPARWLTTGLVREGARAYFLEWRDGVAIGRKVVRNAELAETRAALPGLLATELARIHSINAAAHPALCDALGPGEIDSVGSVLDKNAATLDALRHPRPALELALRWLRDTAPAGEEVTLVHGDFRTGNFLVTPEGLSAVLDWEFVHWGSPAEDLAWVCVRDWRFGRLDQPVGGFAARAPLLDAYAAASGRELDPAALHWWEVMGNVRWAIGCLHQGVRYLSGDRRDLELIAIAARAVEMEYEALRLIEVGHAGA